MRARILFAFLLLLFPAVASGQTDPASCIWETCGLRVEAGGWFSREKVVRGLEAVPVSNFDRSEALRSLLSTNDSASAHYELFAASDRRFDGLSTAGFLVWLAGAIVQVKKGHEVSGWSLGLTAGGTTLLIMSSAPRRRAKTELETAIWWYNGALPRAGGEGGGHGAHDRSRAPR